MPIIDMLKETEIYAKRECDERGYEYISCGYAQEDIDESLWFKLEDIDVTVDNNYVNTPSEIILTARQYVTNNSPETITKTLTFREETSETTTTSTEEGFSVGGGITSTSTFNIFFVEQTIEVSIEAEYNYSSTEEISKTQTREWVDETTVPVSPYHKATVTYVITKGDYSVPVNLECTVKGMMWYDHKVNNEIRRMYVQAYYLLEKNNTPGFTFYSMEMKAKFKGVAKLMGDIGLESLVFIESQPISGDDETKTYLIPLTKKNSLFSSSKPAEFSIRK